MGAKTEDDWLFRGARVQRQRDHKRDVMRAVRWRDIVVPLLSARAVIDDGPGFLLSLKMTID